MEYRGFLFDVDGVLYDSMPQHAKSWIVAFKEAGYKLPALPVHLCEGMPEVAAVIYLENYIHVKLTKDEQQRIVERKREIFNKYPKPRLVRGGKQLIRFLKSKKMKVCMVTGSHQLKTIRLLKKDFGMKRSEIVTGMDMQKGKPHPDPFLKGLRKLKLSAKHCVAIENAPLGIQSAKRAGLTCVALKTGPISVRELKKQGADYVFKDHDHLLRTLKRGVL